MSFWLREIAGWLLVLAGMWLLYECFLMLQERRVIEAGPLSIIGIVVFRGGIHLLKVAVAARVCREAKQRSRSEKAAGRPAAAPPAATAAVRGS